MRGTVGYDRMVFEGAVRAPSASRDRWRHLGALHLTSLPLAEAARLWREFGLGNQRPVGASRGGRSLNCRIFGAAQDETSKRIYYLDRSIENRVAEGRAHGRALTRLVARACASGGARVVQCLLRADAQASGNF